MLARLAGSEVPTYGVSTGFGSLANTYIPAERREELQRALVRSHAAGMGDPVEVEVVRAMLLLRARTLAMGFSGARPAVAEAMLALLNAGLTPVVPEHGSLGASGDLAPLALRAGPDRGGRGHRPRGQAAGRRRSAPRGRHRAADADRQGGPGADQRDRRHARHAPPRSARPPPAADRRRPDRGDVDRGAARHRPGLRRRPPGAPPAPRPGGQRRQPAPAAGRLRDRRQPPRGRQPGAGRLLAALLAPGPRRRPRHGRPRRAGGGGRAGVGDRQPDDPARRPGRVLRQLPRRAARLRLRLPGDRRRRGGRHRRAPHRPPARRRPLAGPAAVPGRRPRGSIRGS